MTFDGYSILLAAEPDAGIGWSLVLLFALVGKWGWMAGLGLLAVIVRFRHSRSAEFGAFATIALPGSLLLLAISIVYFCLPFMSQRAPSPQVEVRSARQTCTSVLTGFEVRIRDTTDRTAAFAILAETH